METLILEKAPEEVDKPWGRATNAIEAALDFWERWGSDPDFVQTLEDGPFTAVTAIVKQLLPKGSSFHDAKLIVGVTQMLTPSKHFPYSESNYVPALNEAYFRLSTEGSDLSGEQLSADLTQEFSLEPRDADEIIRFIKLTQKEK